MCKKRKFECVDAVFEIDEKRPDALEEWIKRYPCVLNCKELERYCEALETVLNLEEMEMRYKVKMVG